MLQDLRYASRALRRNPGFTLAVLATFALGIGMNTAVFSVADALLFRTLPYPDAERLVWMTDFAWSENRDIWTANAEYLFWKTQSRCFERVAAYGDDDVAMVSNGTASQERIAFITGDFWSITAAQPAVGRLFGEHEADELVLSWPFYQRRFSGDPRVVGTTVTLGGHPYRIAGVLRQDFQFSFPQQYIPGDEVRGIDGYIAIPAGMLALPDPLPAVMWEEAQRRFGPSAHAVFVIGKLRPGVSYQRAGVEMRAIYSRYTARKAVFERKDSLDFAPLREKLARGERRALVVLLSAVGFVLLIACANIANLLIARAASRERETAIRAALGAGNLQLVRQVLFESLLLAIGGGTAGLLLARACRTWLAGAVLSGGRHLGVVALDGNILWFALALSLTTGLLSGLGPAIPLWRADLYELLKAGGAAPGLHRLRGKGILVAAELGLAIVLLAGAGLMLKSLWQMNRRPPGFAPENILAMRITLSGPRYASWPPKQAYTEQLLSRLEALPGVQAAGLDAGALNTTVRLEGSDGIGAVIRAVSPRYLRAIGVPVVQGGWPAEGSLFGVMVNQAFARQAGAAVVGKRVGGSILNDSIAGVVPDFKARQLDAEPLPEVYMPYERFPMIRSLRVVVRSFRDAGGMERPVREVLAQVDATQPAYEIETLDRALADSIAPRRFQLLLLGVFAAAALLLAAIGIHGVMAWSVGQRKREIGVRMALGASKREIVILVVRQGMKLAAAGIGPGVLAAAGLTRLMASLLYDVKPNDAASYAAAILGMALTALLACCAPALRAARVDPAVTLRGE
ncbi:MAG TPA: ABC transporter permease [Bryobacteraceae bacterium]|nr:ABC transporter permease [Bryobacteraceae bacterium]